MDSGIGWLVEVRFDAALGVTTSRFYLARGVASVGEAWHAVDHSVRQDVEYDRQGGVELNTQCVQMQRVVRDELGRVRLSAPVPQGESAAKVPETLQKPR